MDVRYAKTHRKIMAEEYQKIEKMQGRNSMKKPFSKGEMGRICKK
jgi:hypothetical protein